MKSRQEIENEAKNKGKEYNPTFLPGDKVKDKRSNDGKVFRIISREAYLDTELLVLREVGNDLNEFCIRANLIIPHLEMVAKYMEPLTYEPR